MADSTDDPSASPEREAAPDPKVERIWRPDSTASAVSPPETDAASALEADRDAPAHDPIAPAEPASGGESGVSLSPEDPQLDLGGPGPKPSGAESSSQNSEGQEESGGQEEDESPSSRTGPGDQGATAGASSTGGDPEGAADTSPSPDAQDLAEAQEGAKRINDEAFADPDGTDQTAQSSPASPDADPHADAEFVTDETRSGSPADRVEEAIQDAAYRQNEGEAKSDWTPRERRDYRIAMTFALLVSKVAEDMSYQQRPGDEFWDPRKIMRRQIDHRPLRHCKMEYTKRRLALLVDTSPSCRDEAVFYSKIASGALLRDDIDIFLCPNGRIEAKFDPEPMRFVTDERGEDWALEGRTVLYFTDWDGSAQLVRHARTCNLYWFDNCDPEQYWESRRERLQRVRLRYRGRHFHCPDPDTFRRLVRKIRP